MIDKMAHPFVLKKGNAPAVAVITSMPSALGKTTEAKGNVGGRVAVHSKQLAHSRAFAIEQKILGSRRAAGGGWRWWHAQLPSGHQGQQAQDTQH